MRKISGRIVGIALIGLLVTGCGSTWPLEELQRTQPKGTAFTQALAKDYQSLSEFEVGQYDWIDARHFALKGLTAAGGSAVLPEDPNEWSLSDQFKPDIVTGRQRLTAALDGGGRDKAPQLAARAQTQFDCWVEQAEEGWQTDHIAACRSGFEKALADIEAQLRPRAAQPAAPAPAQRPAETQVYTVYFEFDSALITPDAARIIDNVIRQSKQPGGPQTIIISGHADRAGPENYNVKLSQRRADAVRQALVQGGIPASSTTVRALGESEPKVPTLDNVREQQNRRVTVEIR